MLKILGKLKIYIVPRGGMFIVHVQRIGQFFGGYIIGHCEKYF
jgi:hypothetical protein